MPNFRTVEEMSTNCVKSSRNWSHLPALILSTHVQTSTGADSLNRANFQAVMTAQRSWKKSDLSFKTDICKQAPELLRHSPKSCHLSLSDWSMHNSHIHHWAPWNCWFFFFKSVKSIQNFKCTSVYCKVNILLQFPLTENRIGWVLATQIDSSFLSFPCCPQLKVVGCATANLWSTPQPVSGWAAVQRWEEVKWWIHNCLQRGRKFRARFGCLPVAPGRRGWLQNSHAQTFVQRSPKKGKNREGCSETSLVPLIITKS